MDDLNPGTLEERQLADTPEDVAVLYSWANLQGAKYRDFSASRREYRAQMRHRAAEIQREEEMRAKAEAEAAAADDEKAAREAEEAARFHQSNARSASEQRRAEEMQYEEAAQQRAMRHAAELNRRAAAERVEAARRAEAVAAAEAAARREAREMAEAQASAARQAARYQESEFMRRSLAGPQPIARVPGAISDPYTDEQPTVMPGRLYHQPVVPDDDMRPTRLPSTGASRLLVPQPDPREPSLSAQPREYWASGSLGASAELAARGGDAIAREAGRENAPISYYDEPDSYARNAAVEQYAQSAPYAGGSPVPRPRKPRYDEPPTPVPSRSGQGRRPRGYHPDEASSIYQSYGAREPEGSVPAWITPQADLGGEPSRVADTLQYSRERVASRWYALKGVFDQGVQEPHQDIAAAKSKDTRVPILSIFSLAGGVGKTSLVATLGRALSSTGEKVLLTDTTSHGLLPFYFGASELRAGAVRTFSPPEGSGDAPIALVSYDVSQKNGDAASQEWLVEEISRNSRGVGRVVVDLSASSPWVVRRLARINSIFVVPVAPDMNSVISLGSVEKFFAGMIDSDGRAVEPYYLLNQFDATLPLHLDVREVMLQKLGERLLPFVIRRSQSVSEALAEGMTVMDYAPDAPVAGDYSSLASWLRSQSTLAVSGFKNARWSER
jgi:cellulose synthase operon protein YhjQ